ncbi:MAG TPA: PAS domain-containing protein [Pyrinomonadaceae bacterium]|nr:PAS domain-containing protein [Pyrinomonadaceae bacterium]
MNQILVVNDLPEVLGFLHHLLDGAGYGVVTAIDGREGLEVANSNQPDLIISDVNMPRMDGIELCRQLRSDARFRTTPILLVSSERKDTPAMLEGMSAGANDYLEVPYDESRLIAKVTQLIEQQKYEAALRGANDQLRSEVKESTARLNMVLKAARLNTWEWNLTNDELTVSDDLIKKGLQPNINSFRDLIHPDDRELVESELRRSIENSDEYDVEFRMVWPNGTTEWTLAKGKAFQDETGHTTRLLGVGIDITARKHAEEAMARSEARFQLISRATNDAVWDWELSTGHVWWNENIQTLFGYTPEQVGHDATWWYDHIHPQDVERIIATVDAAIANTWNSYSGEYRFRRVDNTYAYILERGYVISDKSGDPVRILGSMMDLTEQRALETQLRHAQKLESIGQLAAGIAHEINTPIQYVGDNIRFIQEGVAARTEVLNKYAELFEVCSTNKTAPELLGELQETIDSSDVEYLTAEMPKAIQQSLEGIERIAKIVQSMKDFAHPGSVEKQTIDLNRAIESTITVAKNEWKYVAEIETDFQTDLPSVPCYLGELNQVVLNMIINAAHAITDVVGDGSKGRGTIKISTRRAGESVEIGISDTGSGIPEAIRSRIFDPFFTTKQVGKGTGQGLAISHNVIVEKHGGTISLDSEEGRGTTFTIRLPL